MAKYKLSATITDEVSQILKTMAKEYGTSVGAMICLLVKEKDTARKAVDMANIYKSIDFVEIQKNLDALTKSEKE